MQCSKCNQLKSIEDFPPRKKGKLGSRKSCRSCMRDYHKKIREKNKEKLAIQSRLRYEKKREALGKKARIPSDPITKRIKQNLRCRVSKTVSRGCKCASSIELVGCDKEFLKRYLESKFLEGMSWDNYGRDGWHIDHIKPCCSFDLLDPEQQKECFHYTNLQPLWAEDNWRKGGTFNPQK